MSTSGDGASLGYGVIDGPVLWAAEFVRLRAHGQVGVIEIDRPKMNALDRQVQQEIASAATLVNDRPDLGAVVVTGGPHVFAAGADIKEMAAMDVQAMMAAAPALTAAFSAVARIRQPTIAAICGYALGGGCELALCCDLRVAADNARLGQPEILLGLIPGGGGTQRLARLVGPSRAKDLIFSGRFVDAGEAAAIGLVDRVVAPDQVLNEALAWAATLARGPRLALQAAKDAIDRGLEADLETGLQIERMLFASMFATEDRALGMRSFIESGPGKAEFTGR